MKIVGGSRVKKAAPMNDPLERTLLHDAIVTVFAEETALKGWEDIPN